MIHALRLRHWPALLLVGAALSILPASRAQDKPKVPADFQPYTDSIPGTNLKFAMVPIPGGTFTIGSPEGEEKRSPDEGPQRQVEIKPFWMGKHEVTWDEYDEFAFSLDVKKKVREGVDLNAQAPQDKAADAVSRPTPPYADPTHGLGRKNQPAICMTHHSAMEYCAWLSAKTGKTYRLPTEAEWEYACRAGAGSAYSFGDDPEKVGDYAWYVENSEGPQPVGKKKPNAFGLFDMHGNVAEWCLDHYVEDRYTRFPADKAALGPVALPDEKEYSYVARGGSWDDDPELLRSAARRSSNLEWSVRDPQRPQSIWWHTDATFVGFRVVRALDEQEDLRGLRSKVVTKKGTK